MDKERARALVHEASPYIARCCSDKHGDAGHWEECNRLTAAFASRDTELIEACARGAADLLFRLYGMGVAETGPIYNGVIAMFSRGATKGSEPHDP